MTVKAYVYGCFAGFYWISGSFKPRERQRGKERDLEGLECPFFFVKYVFELEKLKLG